MRIIKYKPSDSHEFENYIDIGVCDRDNYFLDFFKDKGYEVWFENFTQEPTGTKMVIIHHFLSQYMGWNLSENTPQPAYFEDVCGAKTSSIVSSNLEYLLQFHERWFHHESSLFKGLDLAFDDIEDSFTSTVENEEGIRSEIEFNDGSKIQFLDENDSFKSFFVPEVDYLELKTDLEQIVSLFKSNQSPK
jgi:hypothetical protein